MSGSEMRNAGFAGDYAARAVFAASMHCFYLRSAKLIIVISFMSNIFFSISLESSAVVNHSVYVCAGMSTCVRSFFLVAHCLNVGWHCNMVLTSSPNLLEFHAFDRCNNGMLLQDWNHIVFMIRFMKRDVNTHKALHADNVLSRGKSMLAGIAHRVRKEIGTFAPRLFRSYHVNVFRTNVVRLGCGSMVTQFLGNHRCCFRKPDQRPFQKVPLKRSGVFGKGESG